MGGGTKEERSLAHAQIPDCCHCVAGCAIARSSEHGPWSSLERKLESSSLVP